MTSVLHVFVSTIDLEGKKTIENPYPLSLNLYHPMKQMFFFPVHFFEGSGFEPIEISKRCMTGSIFTRIEDHEICAQDKVHASGVVTI